MTKKARDKISSSFKEVREIMTTWNYRIIKHDEAEFHGKEWFGLHEVYTDKGGLSWTQNPISFVCDMEEGPDGIIKSLEQALSDARNRPVLLMSELVAQYDETPDQCPT